MIGRLLRIVALLLAVATATMPGLLAIAEGGTETAAAGAAAAHVEPAGGSDSCPVVHDAHCAACSLLRHGHTGPPSAEGVAPLSRCAGELPASLAAAAPDSRHGSTDSRAPPRG